MQLTHLPPPAIGDDELSIGTIPGMDFPVLLNRREAVSHHTAILGVTGVGKSVFARDLVKKLSSDPDLRIVVVDFTREWEGRLDGDDGPPVSIIPPGEVDGLRSKIEELSSEQSKFRNQQDPAVIEGSRAALMEGFSRSIAAFLRGDGPIGIFELPDLSNTQGVLEYTQWFFRALFHLARDEGCYERRVCIVIEEAHTVIPEWNFIGLADRSSQSLVNNISQIALQGRKYGVGFIVIAQRTANVSKTVLTQCNTIIAFQCFDSTSLEFLSHYLPDPLLKSLRVLRFRRAIAVGKAIRGSVPLLFDVPEILEE